MSLSDQMHGQSSYCPITPMHAPLIWVDVNCYIFVSLSILSGERDVYSELLQEIIDMSKSI